MRYNEHILYDSHNKPVLRTFHTTVVPGRRNYREHHHTECELSLFCSGTGVYSLPGKEYSFAKDDIFLFNSDEVHCITDIGTDESFDSLCIQFEPRILWSDKNFPESGELLRIFFDRSSGFENRIDCTNPQTALIRQEILELEKELEEKQFNYYMIVKMKLYSILTRLVRSYGYVKGETEFSANRETFSRLNKALKFIDENLEGDLKLDELAKIAAMNKSYFSTVFKQFNGISPWEYITIKRVEMAIELLKNTSLTKLEIAQRCGFNSSSNFYQQFKKVTGKLPKDYAAD